MKLEIDMDVTLVGMVLIQIEFVVVVFYVNLYSAFSFVEHFFVFM